MCQARVGGQQVRGALASQPHAAARLLQSKKEERKKEPTEVEGRPNSIPAAATLQALGRDGAAVAAAVIVVVVALDGLAALVICLLGRPLFLAAHTAVVGLGAAQAVAGPVALRGGALTGVIG